MWHGTIVFTGGPPGCALGFGFAVIVSRAIRSFHRDAAGLQPRFRFAPSRSRASPYQYVQKETRLLAAGSPLDILARLIANAKKTASDILSETVIISYYRGATQFDVMSTLACTVIHS